MKKQFFYCMAIAISACGGGPNKGTGEPDAQAIEQEETLTDEQKLARDLCKCAEKIAWDKVDLTQTTETDLEEMKKMFACSMELRGTYNEETINDTLTMAECKRLCPDLQHKGEQLKNLVGLRIFE